jgi:hypothetical protein
MIFIGQSEFKALRFLAWSAAPSLMNKSLVGWKEEIPFGECLQY